MKTCTHACILCIRLQCPTQSPDLNLSEHLWDEDLLIHQGKAVLIPMVFYLEIEQAHTGIMVRMEKQNLKIIKLKEIHKDEDIL